MGGEMRDKVHKKEYDKKYHKTRKEIDNKQSSKWYENNKEAKRQYNKIDHYLRSYNMSLEELDALLEKQDHKCAICGNTLVEKKRNVDHSHKTNSNRGILCTACNMALGGFQDSEDILQKAIDYLRSYN